MSRFETSIRSYIVTYLVVLIVTLIPQLFYTQEDLFLRVNQLHSAVFDKLLYFATYFGDGLAFALVIVLLVFYSYRQALLGLIIFLGTSGVTQFLKRVVFSDYLRPYGKLGSANELYIPDGVVPLLNNSFPSGHATTAFALAGFLTLISKNKSLWPLYLILAILAGYSRIYLTHHFPVDVWTGSVIGTAGAFLFYWWLNDKLIAKFGDKSLRLR